MSARAPMVSRASSLLQGTLGNKMSPRAERRGKKGHFYKPLQRELRRDGFSYRQIARKENTAIYEQTWNGCTEPSVCYEVIRIRRRDGFLIGGKFVEPYEAYPSAEGWGEDGFTVTDKEAAFAKFRELL